MRPESLPPDPPEKEDSLVTVRRIVAKAAAGVIMKAWQRKVWIGTRERGTGVGFPMVKSIREVYDIHYQCSLHPYCKELGGLAGYKMGGIGAAGQPFAYGFFLGSGVQDALKVEDGGGVAELALVGDNLCAVEAEVGFVISVDLPPLPSKDKAAQEEAKKRGEVAFTPRTELEVMAAVESVRLCIEACGNRHSLPDPTELENLADASSGAGVVLGAKFDPSLPVPGRDEDDSEAPTSISAEQLDALSACLYVDGQRVSHGEAISCPMGSPLASLTACANHLNSRGLQLKSGQVVIAGAMCRFKELKVGQKIEARFGWTRPNLDGEKWHLSDDGTEGGLGVVRATVVESGGVQV